MKQLTDFTFQDIRLMEDILYTLKGRTEVLLSEFEESKDFTPDFDTYVKCLDANGYLFIKDNFNHFFSDEDRSEPDKNYIIKEKGKVVCENGGLIPIYERQKSEIENNSREEERIKLERGNSKRAKRAFIMSIIALFLSVLVPIAIELIKLIPDNQ